MTRHLELARLVAGVLDESDERQAAGPERGGARDRTTFLAETLEPRDRVPAAG